MASVDNYEAYEWKDAPDHKTTPTNAYNFNHIEEGIKKNNTAIKTLCTEVSQKAADTQTFTQAETRANINSGETVATIFGKIKKWFADLGTLAFKSTNGSTSNYLRGDGTWVTPPNTTYSNGTGLNLSSNTFSVKYGTAEGTACQGNDTRLSNSRPASDVSAWAKASTKPSYGWNEITGKPSSMPASDVYAWAKAATKPSYSWSEITSKPSTFTPSSHTHPWSAITDKPSTYAPSSHTHSWSSITDKPSTYPPSAHTHDYLPLSGGTLTGDLNGTYFWGLGYYFNGNMGLYKNGQWVNLYNGLGGVAYKAQNHDFRTAYDAWNTISVLDVVYQSNSSRKIKENINPISEDEAKKLLDVNVVSFDYKKDAGFGEGDERKNKFGVIAEDINEVIPYVVNYDRDDHTPSGVDYSKFVPYLIKMVQMQQKEIEELKRR